MSMLTEMQESAFGLGTYEDVMKRVEEGTSRAGFGTYEQVPTVSKDKFGRIGIREFFEEADEGGDIISLETLKELDEAYEWTESNADNTYNYSGFLERDVNLITYTNEDTDEVIVFYAVHVGLDIRGGYTAYFPVLYDWEDGHMYHLTNNFPVAYATFEQAGKEIYVAVDAGAASEWLYVYISDEDNNEIPQSYDQETVDLDTYDMEDFEESLKEYLKENDIPFDEDTFVIER